MEKLQELFTERVNNTLGVTKKHFYDKFEVEKNLNRLDILKQFIKWLVENDKVDFELDRIVHKHKGIDYNTGKGIVLKKLCSRYESLLMMLSIQSYPIEFLISVLK